MNLSLRAGERVFINGAVLRVDRKVTIELMNDATFLLENHVIQPEEATTPLRQLYFAAQTMLIEPARAEEARAVYRRLDAALMATFVNAEILHGLRNAAAMIEAERPFEALKVIRGLYPAEATVLAGGAPSMPETPTRAA
ncbi:flagellar biosynthesis repressor FlbT [Methylobacterium oryzihabitans]|uniref:Probable flagellum biosynthesis repressor protein FlbT n=1 Tax=Methylobacterium oryzihabitans TaxID=2499852 RepID=A0A3S2VXZ3_9HYPH|nr:flagellar biosynthesis repressor FlbT [Methylobacterium oryzihabitans]RVU20273.1 flagellar biosynthesis repressor FlbT [Methylobacterium oryzihabitans]